jgi:leucyl aminopeptidase
MQKLSVTISPKSCSDYRGELLVLPVILNHSGEQEQLSQALLQSLSNYGEFSGKKEQSVLLYPPFTTPPQETLSCRRLLLVGLGAIDTECDETAALRERFRNAGGMVAAQCKAAKTVEIALHFPEVFHDQTLIGCFLEGLLLADYRFLKYKKPGKDEEPYSGLENILFLTANVDKILKKTVSKVMRTAQAVHLARDMASEPGNGWTATHFATHAIDLAKRGGLKCTILEKEEMAALGMGGILAVNQGSEQPPKLVILEYRPKKRAETLLLVGKGLTFDSGGISLKPAQGMMEMKYDMCGGAAVLAAMEVIAVEKPAVGVVAIIPATDNMISGAALKPGDVIVQYGGVTAEIESTDAEGRLLLADALAYGIEKYTPVCAIDLATLTGSMIFALGHHYCGFMSNDDTLAETLLALGKSSGEPLWRMPLDDLYKKQLKSEVADLKNTGGKPAGCITAAEYLHHFVGDTPWAHLDIAGTAWNYTEKAYVPKGPSGFGVRILIDFVRQWQPKR